MSEKLSSVSASDTGLELKGQLSFETVSSLLDKGLALIKNNKTNSLVIDLEGVYRIDSAGISLLLEWKRYCDQNNKDFSLEGMQKQATSLIKTYQLQGLFSKGTRTQ